MKILLLGATGGTGQHIVRQALERSHEVTALVRDPTKLGVAHDRLRVLRGSVTDANGALAEAVHGQDAVVSALGVGQSLKSSNLMARGMPAIVSAMERAAVRRLIVVSAFGVGETRRDVPLLPFVLQRLLLAEVFADKEAGEARLRSSSLDWTLVHPSVLTDGPRTGKYRAGERLELWCLPTISRADVADFVLRQLDDRTYLKKSVLISN